MQQTGIMEDGKPLLKFCAGKDEYCLVGGVVVRLVFGLLTVCMGYGDGPGQPSQRGRRSLAGLDGPV